MQNNFPTQKHVLIVEDEPDLLEALSEKFSRAGFQVSRAKNGEEGVLLAFAEHPDLVLLDLLMPKVSGTTFLNELRKDAWGQKVPVIILTNVEGTEKIVAKILEHGVSDYLVKSSWTIDDIVTKAKEKLSGGKG